MLLTPLVMLAIATLLGTLAAAHLSSDSSWLCALGVLAVVAFAVLRRSQPRQLRAALLIALLFGALNASLHERLQRVITPTRTERFHAVVLDRVNQTTDETTYRIALDSGIIALATFAQTAQIGDRIIARGRLAPFDDARNPGDPSERKIQHERGNDAHIESAALVAREPALHWDPQAALGQLHAMALQRLREQLGEPAATIMAGELWGERDALPPDLRADFQDSGTVHILVTAGLHVGLIAALAAWLLGFLPIPRWLSCAIAIVAVWAFVLWSGLQLPAMRAATMATAALLARACGRAALSWNSLALAALVLAIARPGSVATPSFALSFACVAAIFAWGSGIDALLHRLVALPQRVREALTLTLATQLGTWPITAAVFLQFSPYAVPANFAVVPCVPLTMLLGMAELAMSWCPPIAQALANMNGWIIAWMIGVVRLVGTLPLTAIVMTPAPTWCIASYLAALLVAPALLRRNGATLALTACTLATMLVLLPPRPAQHLLRVTVIDVGQADAILVQTPDGGAIEIDAGGRLERGSAGDESTAERVGERIVVPFLVRHGIHRLDAIILSHPHGDHAGGVAPILRKLTAATLADSGQRYGGHAYADAIATARAEAVPIVYPRAGAVWRTPDGLTLRFLGPSLPLIGGRNAINDNSITFLLQYKHFRMLFTGDAGAAAEQRFLHEGVDLGAQVLKVGHHGSAYASTPEFLAAVHPRYAIISVGRHNMFGHPAPRTIAALQHIGTTIYRTDENGAVTVVTNGTSVSITPMLKNDSDAVSP